MLFTDICYTAESNVQQQINKSINNMILGIEIYDKKYSNNQNIDHEIRCKAQLIVLLKIKTLISIIKHNYTTIVEIERIIDVLKKCNDFIQTIDKNEQNEININAIQRKIQTLYNNIQYQYVVKELLNVINYCNNPDNKIDENIQLKLSNEIQYFCQYVEKAIIDKIILNVAHVYRYCITQSILCIENLPTVKRKIFRKHKTIDKDNVCKQLRALLNKIDDKIIQKQNAIIKKYKNYNNLIYKTTNSLHDKLENVRLDIENIERKFDEINNTQENKNTSSSILYEIIDDLAKCQISADHITGYLIFAEKADTPYNEEIYKNMDSEDE